MFKKKVKKGEETSPQLSNKDKLDAAKKDNIKKKEKFKLKHRKIYIIAAIVLVLIIVIVALLTMYLNNIKYKSYIKYEEKMKTFGFDKLYNNQSAKTSESVTKAEALKLAIATVFNTSDISGFAAEHNEYENAIWVEYAKDTEITKEDININNFNDKAKYLDVIKYFENCKIKFLEDQTIKSVDVKFKDISKYTAEEQTAIKDMVANEIIYQLSNKLNGNKTIFKGQLNELVVNFAEKYNTITMLGDKMNINPEKMPSNAELYPYTLSNIDKSIYEIPLIHLAQEEFYTPRDVYSYKKEEYYQIKRYSEEFFNIILNIDYKTITEKSFKDALSSYVIFRPSDSDIKEYVEHVKNNEIIIEGTGKLQAPTIYYDGYAYRARFKLNFEIKNSKTNINLLFPDIIDGLSETYEKKTYEIIVDYYLSDALTNNNMYIEIEDLYDTISNKETCGIIKEVINVKEDNDENN